ncbi:hypothetical protein [Timonella sp. A28]|uniref:hypothetical protein n=1 Tax=Timonella sp. A28 TaxID=3442640 RepID=UPI003EBC603A
MSKQAEEVIAPIDVDHSWCGGTRREYAFKNGYGASVICSPYSYGGKRGLWELAELYEGDLTGSEPVGFLTEDDVQKKLKEIKGRKA